MDPLIREWARLRDIYTKQAVLRAISDVFKLQKLLEALSASAMDERIFPLVYEIIMTPCLKRNLGLMQIITKLLIELRTNRLLPQSFSTKRQKWINGALKFLARPCLNRYEWDCLSRLHLCRAPLHSFKLAERTEWARTFWSGLDSILLKSTTENLDIIAINKDMLAIETHLDPFNNIVRLALLTDQVSVPFLESLVIGEPLLLPMLTHDNRIKVYAKYREIFDLEAGKWVASFFPALFTPKEDLLVFKECIQSHELASAIRIHSHLKERLCHLLDQYIPTASKQLVLEMIV